MRRWAGVLGLTSCDTILGRNWRGWGEGCGSHVAREESHLARSNVLVEECSGTGVLSLTKREGNMGRVESGKSSY